MTLLEQIQRTERLLYAHQRAVEQTKAELSQLQHQRHDCDHQFSRPHPGYEHEGGYCTKCGINEVHAESQKIGLKYK